MDTKQQEAQFTFNNKTYNFADFSPNISKWFSIRQTWINQLNDTVLEETKTKAAISSLEATLTSEINKEVGAKVTAQPQQPTQTTQQPTEPEEQWPG